MAGDIEILLRKILLISVQNSFCDIYPTIDYD